VVSNYTSFATTKLMQFLKQTNQLNGTVVFTGPHFSMEEAEKIVDSVWERNEKLLSEW